MGRWTRALWVLAAASGAHTLWSIIESEHDGRRVQTIASTVGRARLHVLVQQAEARLQQQAALTASALAAPPARTTAEAQQRLSTLYATDSACACLSLLPARVVAATVVSATGDTTPGIRLAAAASRDELLLRQIVRGAPGTTVEVRMSVREAVLIDWLFAARPSEPVGADTASHVREADPPRLAITDADGRELQAGASVRQPITRVQASVPALGWTVALPVDAHDLALELQLSRDMRRRWLLLPQLLLTIVAVVLAGYSGRAEVALLRARSTFIAGVSHDLRMPLAEVLLAAESLELGAAESPAQRAPLIATILRETRRVIGLVDNVLFFARSDDAVGRAPVATHAITDVSLLLTHAVEGARMAAAAAGQSLVVVTPQVEQVVGDEGQLRQALANLIDNAIKYGPRGQQVTVRATAIDASWAEISVEDAGPGIAARDRARALQPFERLGAADDPARTGSGLGLAIVADIAQACGGAVRILDGADGKGTRVALRLQRPSSGARGQPHVERAS